MCAQRKSKQSLLRALPLITSRSISIINVRAQRSKQSHLRAPPHFILSFNLNNKCVRARSEQRVLRALPIVTFSLNLNNKIFRCVEQTTWVSNVYCACSVCVRYFLSSEVLFYCCVGFGNSLSMSYLMTHFSKRQFLKLFTFRNVCRKPTTVFVNNRISKVSYDTHPMYFGEYVENCV